MTRDNLCELTGQRFTAWTVLEKTTRPKDAKGTSAFWLCRCDCGAVHAVKSFDLRSDRSRSCAECAPQFRKSNHIDLTGQVFGQLTVIGAGKAIPARAVGHGAAFFWLCRCSCGDECEIRQDNLMHKGKDDCRKCAKNRRDAAAAERFVGRKFGQWTVLALAPRPEGYNPRILYWLCRCSCGTEAVRGQQALVTGQTVDCDECRKRKHIKESEAQSIDGIAGAYWTNIIHGAETRELPFDITTKYISDLFSLQDGRCALSGVPIQLAKSTYEYRKTTQTASLDRIDSLKGYVVGNVQWVHRTINRIKWALSDGEFVEWCATVTAFQNAKRIK